MKGNKMKKFAVILIMLALVSPFATAQDKFEPAGATTTVKKAAPAAEKAGEKVVEVAGEEVVTDENGQPVEGEQQNKKQPGLFDSPMILILLGVMVLMFWFSSRAKKKQQQQRQQLVDSLKKGDKVVTIGGICGTIIEARENEIVVSVSDNTRMKFARWAVRSAGEEVEGDKKKDDKDEQ